MIKKKFVKNNSVCKTTFELPKEVSQSARKANIVGDFNNWSIIETPMKLSKSGVFSATLDLESGKEYQFRYLLDETRWENDWEADKYVKTVFGDCDNSVVVL